MENGYKAVMLAGDMLVLLLAVIALIFADNQASTVAVSVDNGLWHIEQGQPLHEATAAVPHLPTSIRRTITVRPVGPCELLGLIPGSGLLLIVSRVDVTQLLTYAVPSFNSNRETSSYTSFNIYSSQPYGRPSNLLRGHNKLPCQAEQMGVRGIFSYLKVPYLLG